MLDFDGAVDRGAGGGEFSDLMVVAIDRYDLPAWTAGHDLHVSRGDADGGVADQGDPSLCARAAEPS